VVIVDRWSLFGGGLIVYHKGIQTCQRTELTKKASSSLDQTFFTSLSHLGFRMLQSSAMFHLDFLSPFFLFFSLFSKFIEIEGKLVENKHAKLIPFL
jgi:hypothetical protein